MHLPVINTLSGSGSLGVGEVFVIGKYVYKCGFGRRTDMGSSRLTRDPFHILFLAVQGLEPRTLCMLTQSSPTKLHSQSL